MNLEALLSFILVLGLPVWLVAEQILRGFGPRARRETSEPALPANARRVLHRAA